MTQAVSTVPIISVLREDFLRRFKGNVFSEEPIGRDFVELRQRAVDILAFTENPERLASVVKNFKGAKFDELKPDLEGMTAGRFDSSPRLFLQMKQTLEHAKVTPLLVQQFEAKSADALTEGLADVKTRDIVLESLAQLGSGRDEIRFRIRTLEKGIENPASIGVCAEELSSMAVKQSGQMAADVLYRKIPLLENGLQSTPFGGCCARALGCIAASGSPRHSAKAFEVLVKGMKDPVKGPSCVYALRDVIYSGSPHRKEKAFALIRSNLLDETMGNNCAFALGEIMAQEENGIYRTKALQAVAANVNGIKDCLLAGRDSWGYSKALQNVIEFGNDLQKGQAFSVFEPKFWAGKSCKTYAQFLSSVAFSQGHGDDSEDFAGSWAVESLEKGIQGQSHAVAYACAQSLVENHSILTTAGRAVNEMLARNTDSLERHMKAVAADPDNILQVSCFAGALNAAARFGSVGYKAKAIEALERGLDSKSTSQPCAKALEEFLYYSSRSTEKDIEQTMLQTAGALARGLGKESSALQCAQALHRAVRTCRSNSFDLIINAVEKGIKSDSPVIAAASANLLNELSCKVNLKERNGRAVAILEGNVDSLERGLNSSQTQLVKESATALVPMALKLASSKEVKEPHVKAMNAIRNFLLKNGLDAESVWHAWVVSTKQEDLPKELVKNLCAISDVEKLRPGIAKTLNKEFGLMTYGRYAPETLTRQFDERGDTATPYGLVIYPRTDNNGAFYNDSGILASLSEQLAVNGALMRIVECDGKLELAKRLILLTRVYGEMSFAVLGGHGTKESIEFGGKDAPHQLLAEDLKGKGVRRSGKFFTAKPTIILSSCWTGVKGGIAQQLSETLNATVIAPESRTSPKEITVEKINDRLVFKVSYLQDVERTYTSGKAEE